MKYVHKNKLKTLKDSFYTFCLLRIPSLPCFCHANHENKFQKVNTIVCPYTLMFYGACMTYSDAIKTTTQSVVYTVKIAFKLVASYTV